MTQTEISDYKFHKEHSIDSPHLSDEKLYWANGDPLQYEILNNIDYIDFLFDKKIIDEQEKERLLQMMKSTDIADYFIAKEILRVKSKEVKI